MIETLAIVHLSSIDSYCTFYGAEAAQKLINDIRIAIVKHPGPVVVMDQEDTDISDDAKVLRQMVLDMQNITTFHHDEIWDVSPWQDGMKRLASTLRKLQTNRVRLGGLWATKDGSSGCVNETQRQLRARNIPCWIDFKISALETNDPRAH